MPPPYDNSSLGSSNLLPNDVDTSSPPINNVISHKVAPSSQDQRKWPLVDRRLSTVDPDISQPSDALSNSMVQTTTSRRSLSSQTVTAQAESFSTQNLATFLADRVSSTVNRDSPPIPAGDQLATPAVQYPPMSSDPVSNLRPRPVAIPATARARGDSVNDTSLENVSGARETRVHIQGLIDSWIGNAKTVLIFNGVFIPTITSFIMDSYKLLSPDIGHQISQLPLPPPTASIIIVNVMWLISLVLIITSTIFATSTLMLQWTRRYPHLPQVPRDHIHSRSHLFLSTLSVFLFLAGLVVFFFIINKIVGVVVISILIAVGLFEVVYLVLRPPSLLVSTPPMLGGRNGAAGRDAV